MYDDLIQRARETTGQEIAERMVERAYVRSVYTGRQYDEVFLAFLRAEFPNLGLTTMSRFNRMDFEFRKEAIEKFKARGSKGPWLTAAMATNTFSADEHYDESVTTAAGARAEQEPGAFERWVALWPWALMAATVLYFGWHLWRAEPGFWTAGR